MVATAVAGVAGVAGTAIQGVASRRIVSGGTGQPLRRRAPHLGHAARVSSSSDGGVTSLDPAAQALLDLYLAHRHHDEDHRQCFARLGAHSYAALLDEALGELSLDLAPDIGVPIGAA